MKNEIIDSRYNWLINKCHSYYFFGEDSLKSRNGKTEFREVRYIVWYILKTYTRSSFNELGRLFNRDHATVMNSLKYYNNIYDTDKDFRQIVDKIEEEYVQRFKILRADTALYRMLSRKIFNFNERSNIDIAKVLIGR